MFGRRCLYNQALTCQFSCLTRVGDCPPAANIPPYAVGPALLIVGSLMVANVAKIPWDRIGQAIPAFITLALMPLTYSIAYGAPACRHLLRGAVRPNIRCKPAWHHGCTGFVFHGALSSNIRGLPSVPDDHRVAGVASTLMVTRHDPNALLPGLQGSSAGC